MFRNPLVSPDILGVSSGASLGAALAILRGSPNWIIQVSAFVGGVAAVAFSYLVSRKSVHDQILSLVLTGSMVMALCNAGVTMIKYISDPNEVVSIHQHVRVKILNIDLERKRIQLTMKGMNG